MQQEPQRTENTPARLNIELIQKAAEQLREHSAGDPSVDEVAKSLDVRVDTLRKAVSVAKSNGGPSWKDMGITVGRESADRIKLRDLLRLGNTKTKKALLLHEVLMIHSQQRVTRTGAHVLGFAALKGVYRRSELDGEYANQYHKHIDTIGALLHQEHRAKRDVRGVFEILDEQIRGEHQDEKSKKLNKERCVSFVKNYAAVKRHHQTHAHLSDLLTTDLPHPIILSAIADIIEDAVENKDLRGFRLNDAQLKVINVLLEQKTSGTFTKLDAAAEQIGFKRSNLQKAWSGQKGKLLGIQEKICESMKGEYTTGELKMVREALDALRNEATISALDHYIIRLVVANHEARLNNQEFEVLTDFEFQVLRQVHSMKLRGEDTSNEGIAKAVGCSTSKIYSCLNGRGRSNGLIDLMNFKLSKLTKQQHENVLGYESPDDILEDSFCQNIRSFVTHSKAMHSRKQRLLDTVEALLGEKLLPPLSAKEVSKSETTTITLQEHEKVRLVLAALAGNYVSFKKLTDATTVILNRNQIIKLSADTFKRFLRGIHVAERKRDGAIRALDKRCKKRRKLWEYLQTHQHHGSVNRETLQKHSQNPLFAELAEKIVTMKDHQKALTELMLHCIKKPTGTLQIIDAAIRNALDETSMETRMFLLDLKNRAAKSLTNISDRQTATDISNAAETFFLKSPSTEVVVSLLRGAEKVGCTPEQASYLFSHLLADYNNDTQAILINQFAAEARGSSITHEPKLQWYTRRVYDRFFEREFSTLVSRKLSDDQKYDIPTLQTLKREFYIQADKSEQRIGGLVESFYRSYAMPTVIRYFRGHLISRRGDRLGLPLQELIEIGDRAVLEAAMQYDPSERIANGEPVRNFMSFAIQMIKWQTSSAARAHRKSNRNISASINDPLNNESDDGSFEDLITEIIPEAISEFDAERLGHVRENLQALSALQRRVLELRFTIDTDIYDPTEVERYDRIAVILKEEGFYDTHITRSRVGQILKEAIRELQHGLLNTAPHGWIDYLTHIGDRERPAPLVMKVEDRCVVLSSKLTIAFLPLADGEEAILSVMQVSSEVDGFHEVIVQAQDDQYKESLGLYSIIVAKGAIISCDKID